MASREREDAAMGRGHSAPNSSTSTVPKGTTGLSASQSPSSPSKGGYRTTSMVTSPDHRRAHFSRIRNTLATDAVASGATVLKPSEILANAAAQRQQHHFQQQLQSPPHLMASMGGSAGLHQSPLPPSPSAGSARGAGGGDNSAVAAAVHYVSPRQQQRLRQQATQHTYTQFFAFDRAFVQRQKAAKSGGVVAAASIPAPARGLVGGGGGSAAIRKLLASPSSSPTKKGGARGGEGGEDGDGGWGSEDGEDTSSDDGSDSSASTAGGFWSSTSCGGGGTMGMGNSASRSASVIVGGGAMGSPMGAQGSGWRGRQKKRKATVEPEFDFAASSPSTSVNAPATMGSLVTPASPHHNHSIASPWRQASAGIGGAPSWVGVGGDLAEGGDRHDAPAVGGISAGTSRGGGGGRRASAAVVRKRVLSVALPMGGAVAPDGGDAEEGSSSADEVDVAGAAEDPHQQALRSPRPTPHAASPAGVSPLHHNSPFTSSTNTKQRMSPHHRSASIFVSQAAAIAHASAAAMQSAEAARAHSARGVLTTTTATDGDGPGTDGDANESSASSGNNTSAAAHPFDSLAADRSRTNTVVLGMEQSLRASSSILGSGDLEQRRAAEGERDAALVVGPPQHHRPSNAYSCIVGGGIGPPPAPPPPIVGVRRSIGVSGGEVPLADVPELGGGHTQAKAARNAPAAPAPPPPSRKKVAVAAVGRLVGADDAPSPIHANPVDSPLTRRKAREAAFGVGPTAPHPSLSMLAASSSSSIFTSPSPFAGGGVGAAATATIGSPLGTGRRGTTAAVAALRRPPLHMVTALQQSILGTGMVALSHGHGTILGVLALHDASPLLSSLFPMPPQSRTIEGDAVGGANVGSAAVVLPSPFVPLQQRLDPLLRHVSLSAIRYQALLSQGEELMLENKVTLRYGGGGGGQGATAPLHLLAAAAYPSANFASPSWAAKVREALGTVQALLFDDGSDGRGGEAPASSHGVKGATDAMKEGTVAEGREATSGSTTTKKEEERVPLNTLLLAVDDMRCSEGELAERLARRESVLVRQAEERDALEKAITAKELLLKRNPFGVLTTSAPLVASTSKPYIPTAASVNSASPLTPSRPAATTTTAVTDGSPRGVKFSLDQPSPSASTSPSAVTSLRGGGGSLRLPLQGSLHHHTDDAGNQTSLDAMRAMRAALAKTHRAERAQEAAPHAAMRGMLFGGAYPARSLPEWVVVFNNHRHGPNLNPPTTTSGSGASAASPSPSSAVPSYLEQYRMHQKPSAKRNRPAMMGFDGNGDVIVVAAVSGGVDVVDDAPLVALDGGASSPSPSPSNSSPKAGGGGATRSVGTLKSFMRTVTSRKKTKRGGGGGQGEGEESEAAAGVGAGDGSPFVAFSAAETITTAGASSCVQRDLTSAFAEQSPPPSSRSPQPACILSPALSTLLPKPVQAVVAKLQSSVDLTLACLAEELLGLEETATQRLKRAHRDAVKRAFLSTEGHEGEGGGGGDATAVIDELFADDSSDGDDDDIFSQTVGGEDDSSIREERHSARDKKRRALMAASASMVASSSSAASPSPLPPLPTAVTAADGCPSSLAVGLCREHFSIDMFTLFLERVGPLAALERLSIRQAGLDTVALVTMGEWALRSSPLAIPPLLSIRGALHTVDLSGNRIKSSDLPTLEAVLFLCPHLRSLSLRNNPLRSSLRGDDTFATLESLLFSLGDRLEHLDVGLCGLNDSAVGKICSFLRDAEASAAMAEAAKARAAASLRVDKWQQRRRTLAKASLAEGAGGGGGSEGAPSIPPSSSSPFLRATTPCAALDGPTHLKPLRRLNIDGAAITTAMATLLLYTLHTNTHLLDVGLAYVAACGTRSYLKHVAWVLDRNLADAEEQAEEGAGEGQKEAGGADGAPSAVAGRKEAPSLSAAHQPLATYAVGPHPPLSSLREANKRRRTILDAWGRRDAAAQHARQQLKQERASMVAESLRALRLGGGGGKGFASQAVGGEASAEEVPSQPAEDIAADIGTLPARPSSAAAPAPPHMYVMPPNAFSSYMRSLEDTGRDAEEAKRPRAKGKKMKKKRKGAFRGDSSSSDGSSSATTSSDSDDTVTDVDDDEDLTMLEAEELALERILRQAGTHGGRLLGNLETALPRGYTAYASNTQDPLAFAVEGDNPFDVVGLYNIQQQHQSAVAGGNDGGIKPVFRFADREGLLKGTAWNGGGRKSLANALGALKKYQTIVPLRRRRSVAGGGGDGGSAADGAAASAASVSSPSATGRSGSIVASAQQQHHRNRHLANSSSTNPGVLAAHGTGTGGGGGSGLMDSGYANKASPAAPLTFVKAKAEAERLRRSSGASSYMAAIGGIGGGTAGIERRRSSSGGGGGGGNAGAAAVAAMMASSGSLPSHPYASPSSVSSARPRPHPPAPPTASANGNPRPSSASTTAPRTTCTIPTASPSPRRPSMAAK